MPQTRSSKRTKKTFSVFEQGMARLNPAQAEAVRTIEGPVMCIAGPGTGKTEVVALRVANILKTTHVRPSNVLCLTFSKSGATAMRKRLRPIIAADAYAVTIDTLHGFCNSIIKQHPMVFEQWSAMTQISDVERYRELNKIIDQLLPDCPLVNAKSPHMRTRSILERIAQLKREGKTDSEELEKICIAYDSQMAGKSRPDTAQHQKNLLAAKKFRSLVEIFHRYQDMLSSSGRYDYEDMILRVIDVLQEEDWLLASLQERYHYILVDEFQDTNGSQNSLINLLTLARTPEDNPNLFVVGDDDQAIYRFQGANLQNILSFRDRFPSAPVISLTVSYRCSQPILDAASSLISHNTERLVGTIPQLQKDLTAGSERGKLQPHLLLSASDMTEPWMVADVVRERLDSGTKPEEIAVLTWKNSELLLLHEVFVARAIPVQMSGKMDLLSHTLIRQVIALLRAVHDPQSSSVLADALSCPCFSLQPADLGRLFGLRREKKCSLLELLLDEEAWNELQLSDRDHLLSVRDVLLGLHYWSTHRTVVETLEHLYRDCGLLARANDATMNIVDFAALQEFFDRIKQRALEHPHFRLEMLMHDLDLYADPEYGDLRLSYDLPHLTREGVQLMTAHRSKGLEFQTVILTNFREGHWDQRMSRSGVSVPEDLLFSWEKDQKTYEQHQDERRVCYVAMTRAKEELIFSCPVELTTGDSVKAVSPSGFFAEAGDLPEKLQEVKDPAQMSTLLASEKPVFDDAYKAFLMQRLEHFELSATALNDFLDDPQIFLERHLLQKPQAKQLSFAYGNAVHHALAKWAHALQEEKPMSEEVLLSAFERHLDGKEILTETQRSSLKNLGRDALPRYFQQRLQGSASIAYVEYDLHAHLGDIPLRGKIDRIDVEAPDSKNATVIDYKTGRPKSEKQIEQYGYRRQLVFYALLMEHSSFLLEPTEFVLEFIGEGTEKPREWRFSVTEQEKEELTALIKTVWKKILALDFSP